MHKISSRLNLIGKPGYHSAPQGWGGNTKTPSKNLSGFEKQIPLGGVRKSHTPPPPKGHGSASFLRQGGRERGEGRRNRPHSPEDTYPPDYTRVCFPSRFFRAHSLLQKCSTRIVHKLCCASYLLCNMSGERREQRNISYTRRPSPALANTVRSFASRG